MPENSRGLRIEDYAIIGDTHTIALVGNNGSIDWLCLPRIDSPACFSALLQDPDGSCWRISPEDPEATSTRSYRGNSLVLETTFETREGRVRVIDGMPPRSKVPDIARVVRGEKGRVRMKMQLKPRFEYGLVSPWVRHHESRDVLLAGPDALYLQSDVPTEISKGDAVSAEFTIGEGDEVGFVLAYSPSHHPGPDHIDPRQSLESTVDWWESWASICRYEGSHPDLVMRSLITLKALTYSPTGGIIAAGTTSLPESLGGVRNWDYRLCWLRDAAFTLYALSIAGYIEEAKAWRDWLLRAAAGRPEELQGLYGPAGERRLPELELAWLGGYENSKPVRIGNAAAGQFQLDVYGEVMDSMHLARRGGMEPREDAWAMQLALMDFVQDGWKQPDEGIWEVRGPRRHFTHSKVLAWVAVDRAIKATEQFGVHGPAEKWRGLRDEIRSWIERECWNDDIGAYVQFAGGHHLDSAVLLLPLVGFIPAHDPRMVSTVRAIEERLGWEGLLLRYGTEDEGIDGLPAGEGAFLPCTFWLADNYALMGRHDRAEALFEKLCALSNDVGLYSEEYHPEQRRMLGNFPQAFTHVSLVNTAHNISGRPSNDPREEPGIGESSPAHGG